MNNNIVLDYHNSLLRDEDIKLLNDHCWLNDNIIGFVYEYLENDEYPNHLDDILLINPGTAQLIKFLEEEELCALLDSLNVLSKKLVFLPVNDNSISEPGGSHWSLLVFNMIEKKCYSFDSSKNYNEIEMKFVFQKLRNCFSDSEGEFQLIHNPDSVAEFQLIQPPCPQQTNAYDCGMYLICITEQLCKQYVQSILSFDDLKQVITPELVKKRRQDIKLLIRKLSNE